LVAERHGSLALSHPFRETCHNTTPFSECSYGAIKGCPRAIWDGNGIACRRRPCGQTINPRLLDTTREPARLATSFWRAAKRTIRMRLRSCRPDSSNLRNPSTQADTNMSGCATLVLPDERTDPFQVAAIRTSPPAISPHDRTEI